MLVSVGILGILLFLQDTRLMNYNVIESQECCVVNDGVDYIQYNQLLFYKVTCNNGAIFKLKRVETNDVLQN